MSQPPLVVLFDPDSLSPDDHEAALRSGGYRTERARAPDAAMAAIDGGNPAALVVVEGRAGATVEGRVCHAARDRGIPVFGLIDHDADGASLSDRVVGYDGWAHYACPTSVLVARLGLILNGHAPERPPSTGPVAIPVDVRLLAMVVHDVRNPLNVIGLTLRVIEQMSESHRAELQEDLTFLRENAGQIERILAVLSDLCRLSDLGPPSPVELDPNRFVEDLLADRAARGGGKGFPARFVAEPGAPATVAVDPIQARLALLSALTNAAAAADGPLVVRSSGGGGRWTVSIDVDRPPPQTVHPGEARPDRFERVIASASDRQGLDLAIAAWIARRAGGSVRLDVVPGRRSSVVLDWPVRPA